MARRCLEIKTSKATKLKRFSDRDEFKIQADPKGFWALEVKQRSNLGPDDVRGLLAFKEEYPEATCFFLVASKRAEVYRGIPVLPVEEFLLNLSPDTPLLT